MRPPTSDRDNRPPRRTCPMPSSMHAVASALVFLPFTRRAAAGTLLHRHSDPSFLLSLSNMASTSYLPAPPPSSATLIRLGMNGRSRARSFRVFLPSSVSGNFFDITPYRSQRIAGPRSGRKGRTRGGPQLYFYGGLGTPLYSATATSITYDPNAEPPKSSTRPAQGDCGDTR